MTAFTLSVVVPTYNASPFIAATLASVFAQTRLPDEVIVVDDCSPDGTVALVESIAATAPVPVRVIRLPANSGGPSAPMNAGIRAARGTLIATLDHDDRMAPDRLSLQAGLCERHPRIGLCTGAVECVDLRQSPPVRTLAPFPATVRKVSHPGGEIVGHREAHRQIVRLGCYARSCSTLTFWKTTWDRVGGFDESIRTCVDLGFLISATAHYDIGVVEAPVATYFFSQDSLYSASRASTVTADEVRAYGKMERELLGEEVGVRYDHFMARLHADHAYHLRSRGDYRGAGRSYLKSLRFRASLSPVFGLAKLVPHWVLGNVPGRGRR